MRRDNRTCESIKVDSNGNDSILPAHRDPGYAVYDAIISRLHNKVKTLQEKVSLVALKFSTEFEIWWLCS